MERAKPYLKGAAVLSTVALMGAFVAYRAGAFQLDLQTDAPPAPEVAAPAGAPSAAPSEVPPLPVIPSVAPADDSKPPAIMPGSKSLGPLGVVRTDPQPNTVSPLPVPSITPPPAPSTTPPSAPSIPALHEPSKNPPPFIGGPKSAPIFTIPAAPNSPNP
jgi:hypothetical protein